MFFRYFKATFWLLRIVIVAVVLLVGGFFLLVEHVSSQFAGTAELPADCAIVFGAAVHRGNASGPGIQRRVETAVNLYKKDQITTLFMTGGKGNKTQDSEAEVMQRLAVTMGVPTSAIVLESQATSTWENLAYVRPLVLQEGCTSVIAISDAYHLARIQYLASQQEWGNLRTLSAERRPNRTFELRATVREALGLVYYFFNQFFYMEKVLEVATEPPTL